MLPGLPADPDCAAAAVEAGPVRREPEQVDAVAVAAAAAAVVVAAAAAVVVVVAFECCRCWRCVEGDAALLRLQVRWLTDINYCHIT